MFGRLRDGVVEISCYGWPFNVQAIVDLEGRYDENGDSDCNVQVVVWGPVSTEDGWELEEVDESAESNLYQVEYQQGQSGFSVGIEEVLEVKLSADVIS